MSETTASIIYHLQLDNKAINDACQRLHDLSAIVADRAACSGCDGWFPIMALLPATPHPDAGMICRGCAAKEYARKVIAEIDGATESPADTPFVGLRLTFEASNRLNNAIEVLRRMMK